MPVDTSAPLRDILEDYKNKNADELYDELGKIPFFMSEISEETPQVEALRALAYEGTPEEIATNFKNQGNDCFKQRKYKDAQTFYTQALDQKCTDNQINIACLGNRAQCNLMLKNYRSCIFDCTKVLELDNLNEKAWFRSAKAFLSLDKIDECLVCLKKINNVDSKELEKAALKRKQTLNELELKKQKKQQHLQAVRSTLESALKSRKYTFKTTNLGGQNVGDLKCKLENELDLNSTLFLPVLALYPLKLKSDVLEQIDEDLTINELINELFSNPPEWADKDYTPQNLECYLPTKSGGLAKIGKNITFRKAYGSGSVVFVDNMARVYFVPKNMAAGWVKEWRTINYE